MKKFMQVGLFMGTFLLSSQLFGQTTEKRGELPVCPVKSEKMKAEIAPRIPLIAGRAQELKTLKMKAEIAPRLPLTVTGVRRQAR